MALSAAGNAGRGGKGVVMAMDLRPSDQPEALPQAMDNGEEQGGDSGSRSGFRPHRGFLLPGPGHDEAEWEPPSEAELKVIQARRERQDKISKLMSEYLLKGYRMLGECCDECGVSEAAPGRVQSAPGGSFLLFSLKTAPPQRPDGPMEKVGGGVGKEASARGKGATR